MTSFQDEWRLFVMRELDAAGIPPGSYIVDNDGDLLIMVNSRLVEVGAPSKRWEFRALVDEAIKLKQSEQEETT